MKIDGVHYTKNEVKELVKNLREENERLREACEISDDIKSNTFFVEENVQDFMKTIFDTQKEIQEMYGYIVKENVSLFRQNILHLFAEVGEVLQADQRWNWERIKKENNKEEKLIEFTDVMACLVNSILYSGFTYSEFMIAYLKKSHINKRRALKEGDLKNVLDYQGHNGELSESDKE